MNLHMDIKLAFSMGQELAFGEKNRGIIGFTGQNSFAHGN